MLDMQQNKELMVSDFVQANKRYFEKEILQEMENDIRESLTADIYHVRGSVITGKFYFNLEVEFVENIYEKMFRGVAGAVGAMGSAYFNGELFTKDIQKLFEETDSFEMNAFGAYTNIYFFDHEAKFLGQFQAGAITIIEGVFGGSGRWQYCPRENK